MNSASNTQEFGTEYNWHPKVHAHKGEELWFFLIRFKDPTRGVVEDQISSALETAGIPFACKYTLFGYWDALIRVWMTEAVKRRFLAILKQDAEQLGIDESRYFTASGLHYLWHDAEQDLFEHGPGNETVNAFEGEVREVGGDASLLAPDERDALLGKDLLIVRPPGADDAVKFYVTLEYTAASSLAPEREVALMLRAIKSAGISDRSSLYTGHGCARFMLRCTADDFASVRQVTKNLYLELRELYMAGLALRPTTYIIIEAVSESDNPNFFRSLSLEDELTAERLDLTVAGRSRFAEMSQQQRFEMQGLVRQVDRLALLDQRLSPKLTELLRACVEEDPDAVVTSYSFIFDFEPLFREYMIHVWSSRYPGNWRAALAESLNGSSAAGKVNDSILKEPGDWSFGTVHKLAELSGRADPRVQEILTRELGADWHGQIKALVNLRNFAAHSKIKEVDKLGDLAGEWGIRVRELIASADLYFDLDKLLRGKEPTHDRA